jgi:hypothetical protein
MQIHYCIYCILCIIMENHPIYHELNLSEVKQIGRYAYLMYLNYFYVIINV